MAGKFGVFNKMLDILIKMFVSSGIFLSDILSLNATQVIKCSNVF